MYMDWVGVGNFLQMGSARFASTANSSRAFLFFLYLFFATNTRVNREFEREDIYGLGVNFLSGERREVRERDCALRVENSKFETAEEHSASRTRVIVFSQNSAIYKGDPVYVALDIYLAHRVAKV